MSYHDPTGLPGPETVPIFRIQSFLKERRERRWLVEELIPESALMICAGAPKQGKTLAGLEILRALVLGEPAFGQFQSQFAQGMLVQLDQNESTTEYQLRRMGFGEAQSLHVCHSARISLKTLEHLHGFIEKEGTRLVVLDTLLRFMLSAEENSASHVDSALMSLRNVARETRCAFLLIHHARKGSRKGGLHGEELRGSSAIYAGVDGRLSLMNGRMENGARVATLEVSTRETPDRKWKLQFSPETFRWQVVGEAEEEGQEWDTPTMLLATLRRLGEASTRQLAAETGKSRMTICRVIEQLGEQVCIVRKDQRSPIYALKSNDFD